MKKTLFTCFTGSLLAMAMTSSIYAQNANSTAKVKTQSSSSFEEINAPKVSAPAYLNDINTKAVRNFIKDYRNVSDVKWLKLDKGFSVVYFTMNGIQTRLLYNKKGGCEWMIRDYLEDKLPYEIRHLVKSTYYDFNIFLITEVTADDKTAYLVKMEDKTCWKTIKIVDEEMEIVEEFLKG